MVDYAEWGLDGDLGPVSGGFDQRPTAFNFGGAHHALWAGHGERMDFDHSTYAQPADPAPWDLPASPTPDRTGEGLVSRGLACRPFF
jgi:hypothetical protein